MQMKQLAPSSLFCYKVKGEHGSVLWVVHHLISLNDRDLKLYIKVLNHRYLLSKRSLLVMVLSIYDFVSSISLFRLSEGLFFWGGAKELVPEELPLYLLDCLINRTSSQLWARPSPTFGPKLLLRWFTKLPPPPPTFKASFTRPRSLELLSSSVLAMLNMFVGICLAPS